MFWFEKLKSPIFVTLLLTSFLEANDNFGLIGGSQNVTTAYAAFIAEDGTVQPLSSLPTGGGLIESVAINSLGRGLIGGRQTSFNHAYAALIAEDGTVQPLTSLPGAIGSEIRSVALNHLGRGIIGGRQNNTHAYAAFILYDGTVIPISPMPGAGSIIFSVALNENSLALLGGNKNAIPEGYAAFVSSDGTVSPLASLPGSGSEIRSVALNSLGRGLIGGRQNTTHAYAAFVTPEGTVTPLSPLPTTNAMISSVAINNTGTGVVGGHEGNDAYAALILANGTLMPLSPLPVGGGSLINSVDLNNSNKGLIGGKDNGKAYAAFVSADGSLTPLSPLPTVGAEISSVAINDRGVGLLGGKQNASQAYAALVTPAGQIVSLNVPPIGSILSVALKLLSTIPTSGLHGNNRIFAEYINQNAPEKAFYFLPAFLDGTLSQALESAAPTRNALSFFTASYNLFYLNHALSNHLQQEHFSRFDRDFHSESLNSALPAHDLSLIASNADDLLPTSDLPESSLPSEDSSFSPSIPSEEHPYSLWFNGLGALSFQKSQQQTVGFEPRTGAFIAGFDTAVGQSTRLGIGAAYSYTTIHEQHHAGHSHINQEYLFLYGLYHTARFYLDAALWGSLFQTKQVRKIHMTGFDFKSSSKPKGWQLSPHLEVGYSVVQNKRWSLTPFMMVDAPSSWQKKYHEVGNAPFNAEQRRHQSMFLRMELGVQLREVIEFASCRLVFKEKGSYVYEQPFKTGGVQASLVGSPGSFIVGTLTSTRSLGVAELGMSVEPVNNRYPYSYLNYQGEFGPRFQSHLLSLQVGWKF